MFLIEKVNMNEKIKKLFKNVTFPKEKATYVNQNAALPKKNAWSTGKIV